MRTETLDAERLELPDVNQGGLRSNTEVKRLNTYPGARPYRAPILIRPWRFKAGARGAARSRLATPGPDK